MSSAATADANRITLSEMERAPSGAVKWKALFDNTNPITNKVLLRSTHTEDLIPWQGFGCQKDHIFTSIPLSEDQRRVIRAIEERVSQFLKRQEWSQTFKMLQTEKIFPRYGDCVFFEKKEDGCLHRVEADFGTLHNSAEKTLTAAALLHLSGVYFDYSKHLAKLTFKLVSLVYQWTDSNKSCEDICTNYMTFYGKLAGASLSTDIVEEAVKASGLDSVSVTSEVAPASNDKESFLASLAKIRTANGVRKRLNKIRRDKSSEAEPGFLDWAQEQALKHMFALKAKADKDEEKKRVQLAQLMKPLQSQPPPQQEQQQQQQQSIHHPMDVELFDSDDEASDAC